MSRWKKIQGEDDLAKLKRGMYILKQETDELPPDAGVGEGTKVYAVEKVKKEFREADLIYPETQGLGLDLGYPLGKATTASPLHKTFDALIADDHWYYDLKFEPPKA